MQTIDHRILAEFLETRFDRSVPDIFRKAFIFGAIEPDLNFFTYFHGWKRGTKMHGHNYENILPVMKSMFMSFENKTGIGIWDYYRLGKLTHYVADSFTYPHNGNFTGNLSDHCDYETELHGSFTRMMSGNHGEKLSKAGHNTGEAVSTDDKVIESCYSIKDFSDIEKMHDLYMQENGTVECDVKYIPVAVSGVFACVYDHAFNKLPIKEQEFAG